MTFQFDSVLGVDRAGVGRLQDQLESACRAAGFPERKMHEAQLAVEEHLANILGHGFVSSDAPRIHVHVAIDDAELRVQVADNGPPFNPIEHPPPDLSLPLDKRPLGGLGIHMMKQSVDSLNYVREKGRNILTLIKKR